MPPQGRPLPASVDRPLPLVRHRDLAVEHVVLRGVDSWIVKDPVTLNYYRLTAEQHTLLDLLDGTKSTKQLRESLVDAIPDCRPSVEEVRRLAFNLFEMGLVYSTRRGQTQQLAQRARKRRRTQLRSVASNLLFIRFPGFSPGRLLDLLCPCTQWIMSMPSLLVGGGAILAAWVSLVIHAETVARQLPNLSDFASPRMLLLLWLTVGLSKVLHELGHAVACRRLGGECHKIGVALLLLSPCLYCDVSDAAMFPERWKRLAVGAAGLWIELLLSAAAVGAWWLLEPGMLRDAAVCLFLATNFSAVAMNLNPLLRLDGYYLLSDWLETPNLRRRADQALGSVFARRALGVANNADDPHNDRRRPFLLAYAVASACYRWSYLAVVTLSLWWMLRPWGLGAVGIAIGGVVAAISLVHSARRAAGFIASHHQRLTASWRARVTASVVASLVAAFFLAPVPWSIEAPLVVEPDGIQHVYVSTPGRLVSIHAGPSESVSAGQVIAVLDNPIKQNQYLQRWSSVRAQQIEVASQQALGDTAAYAVSTERLRRLHSRAAVDYEQVQDLVIRAPCAGRIVEPPPTPPSEQGGTSRLVNRASKPLDASNFGATITSGTRVASIAPNASWRAILRIAQKDRHDFVEGAFVRLQVDGLPGQVWRGRIEHLTTWADHTPPVSSLAEAPTLDPIPYRAQVLMGNPSARLVNGMTGRARVTVTNRTAFGWVWRRLRLMFNTPA